MSKSKFNVKELVQGLIEQHKIVPLSAAHRYILKTVSADSKPSEERRASIHEMVEKCVSHLESEEKISVHELFSASEGNAYSDSLLVVADLHFQHEETAWESKLDGIVEDVESSFNLQNSAASQLQLQEDLREEMLKESTKHFAVSVVRECQGGEPGVLWSVFDSATEVMNLLAVSEVESSRVFAMLPIKFEAKISMSFPSRIENQIPVESLVVSSGAAFDSVLQDLGSDVDEDEDQDQDQDDQQQRVSSSV